MDFELHHLIVIRGKMNEEFAKTANKQDKLYFNSTIKKFMK